jgi:DNA-binding FadR family transcriptional regulator
MYSARWLLSASRKVTNEAPGGLHLATEAHAKIFAALESHDPDAAREAMRSHLQRNYAVLANKNQTEPAQSRSAQR